MRTAWLAASLLAAAFAHEGGGPGHSHSHDHELEHLGQVPRFATAAERVARKRIVITGIAADIQGGNKANMEFAKLMLEEGCYVYLGSRTPEKAKVIVDSILKQRPEFADRLEPMVINMMDHETLEIASWKLAVELGKTGEMLLGLVNTAAVGVNSAVRWEKPTLGQEGDYVAGQLENQIEDHIWSAQEALIRTNYFGPVEAVRAFLPLIDSELGRIVNVVSDAAAEYVAGCSAACKAVLTNVHVTAAEIEGLIQSEMPSWKEDSTTAYGLSRAALMSYTMVVARETPTVKSISCSKPVVCPKLDRATAAARPSGGCGKPADTFKCLRNGILADLPGNGWHYGWDGVRAPLDSPRAAFSPAFEGPPFASDYPLASTCMRRRRLGHHTPFANARWGYPASTPDGCEPERLGASRVPRFGEPQSATGGGYIVAGAGVSAGVAGLLAAAVVTQRRARARALAAPRADAKSTGHVENA